MYREVKASNLVKIDLNGNIVEPSDYRVNPAGFVVHSAIGCDVMDDSRYAARGLCQSGEVVISTA